MSVEALVNREERPPLVRFERRAVEDKARSLELGHYVAKDIDYVQVTPPFSKDCFESKVEQWFATVERNVRENRTPQKWLEYWKKSYENFKKGEETPLNGTPIKDWSAISPAQIKMLIHLNILTIEDMAVVNDEGLRRIGMGGLDLKRKANAWLQAAKDHGPLVMENAALKTQIEQMAGSISSLQDQIKRLQNQVVNVAEQNLSVYAPKNGLSAADILEEIKESPVSELDLLREEYRATFGKEPHPLTREKGLKIKLGIK